MVSAICAVITCCVAIRVAIGVYTVLGAEKKHLEIEPGELGRIFGNLIAAPFALAFIFGFLAWKLWNMANIIRAPFFTEANKAKISVYRKIEIWALIPVTYILGWICALEVLNSIMGAIAILTAESPRFDHSPLNFGYTYELFFWLPSGMAILFAVLTLGSWKLKYLLAKRSQQD